MPDSPYISDPGWTCTITAGSATVPVSGVVAHLVIQAGDHLVGSAGGLMAIGAVTASTITLLRNAPAAQAGAAIPLIVERGPWRAMPAAAAIVSREVYERMQIAASDGRSLPVISILSTPPASPTHGDRYLIGTSPTGAWAGRANSVAEWSDVVGGWFYAAPVEGWSVTINGTKLRYQYGGGSWGTAQVAASDIAVTPVAGIAGANVQAVVAELARPRTSRGNAAYTILAADRDVILTAALTAARVWTLPAANAVPAGTAISVADEVGGISSTNTLTLQCAGSDTIEGATSLVLGQPYQAVRVVSDGVSRWTVVSQGDDARKIARAGDQMAGALAWAASVDIASAATTALGGAASNLVRITGTTAITSFGAAPAGAWRQVLFAAALTLTHNATSLILPGGASIVTAAGDTLVAVSEGGGNWRVVSYTRAAAGAAKPAFRANGSGADVVVGGGAVVQFGTVVTNIGSGYNGSTHKFTAPVAGLYAFAVGLFSNEAANTERYYLSVNGGAVDGSYLAAIPPGSGIAMTGTALRALAAGDVVDVRASAGNGKLYGSHLSFAGWLIG